MDPTAEPAAVLREPVPGRLYPWVKRASYFELALFIGLLVVWIAPGMERATFYFGLAHGIGFIVLAIVVWIAVLRHEAPWTLLAATLTPVGPVGSVIAIHFIELRWAREGVEMPLRKRRYWRGGTAGGRGSTRPSPPPARR